MRSELESLLNGIAGIPADQLPQFIGELESVKAAAWARLTSPEAASAPQHDELLDIDAAAARLGMSTDYLYRHSKRLPFISRMGRQLRFSANGIDRYIKQQCHIDSKTAKGLSSSHR